jgi:plasmid stabilization system protein ParE
MANRLVVAEAASRDIADIFDYLAGYSAESARRVITDLERVLRNDVALNPTLYRWSDLAGCPYRSRLYRLSRQTQYWIIFRHESDAGLVRVVRIWNTSRDPAKFEL